MSAQLYKVLVGAASCSGGRMTWSLPTQGPPGVWTPGAWHEVEGEVVLCCNGLHLTDQPAKWWTDDATAYAVEAEGIVGSLDSSPDRKVAAKRVRLLRPVDPSGFLDALEVEAREAQVRAQRNAATREAAAIVEKARMEAHQILLDADGRRIEKRRQKERAEAARVASLTPAQRHKERLAGTVEFSAVAAMVNLAYSHSSGSRRRTTAAVWAVLVLARDTGVRFEPGDVADARRHRGVDISDDAAENFYAGAVEARNDSAAASAEHCFGRKPWIWQGRRLVRGSAFRWEGLAVKVTSFDDSGEGAFVACAYETQKRSVGTYEYETDKVVRRFTITREAFVAARKAAKGGAK